MRSVLKDGVEVARYYAFNERAFGPAFFGKGDEKRARLSNNLCFWAEVQYGLLIRAAFDRAFRSGHRNAVRLRNAASCTGSGANHADDRQVRVFFPQGGQGCRSCCIASYNEHLYAVLDERFGALQGVALYRCSALGAVGESGGVAKIDEVFMRELFLKRPEDREPTHAGVKNADGQCRGVFCHAQDLARGGEDVQCKKHSARTLSHLKATAARKQFRAAAQLGLMVGAYPSFLNGDVSLASIFLRDRFCFTGAASAMRKSWYSAGSSSAR